jgi:hypothetical protein
MPAAPIWCRAKAVAAGLRMPMARLAPMKGRSSWPAAGTEAAQELIAAQQDGR